MYIVPARFHRWYGYVSCVETLLLLLCNQLHDWGRKRKRSQGRKSRRRNRNLNPEWERERENRADHRKASENKHTDQLWSPVTGGWAMCSDESMKSWLDSHFEKRVNDINWHAASRVSSTTSHSVSDMLPLFCFPPDLVVIEPTSSTLLQG